MGARVAEPQLSRAGWRLLHESSPGGSTPGRETRAPDAGFEVVTLPSLIGQIWLWRSEATFSSRTPPSRPQPSPRILCFP